MLKFKFWPRFSVVFKLQRPALPVTEYANCSANCVFQREEREEKKSFEKRYQNSDMNLNDAFIKQTKKKEN